MNATKFLHHSQFLRSSPLTLTPITHFPKSPSILSPIRSTTNNNNDNPPPPPPQSPAITPPETVEIRFRRGSRRRRREEEQGFSNESTKKKVVIKKNWEEMDFNEKAIELYMGEKGFLFWVNKFAYASIFIIIGGWILFRFVGPSFNLYQLDTPPLSPESVFKGS